jgi:hypothetical protein
MKTIAKDEIYQHLNSFLKGRGIELKKGSYAQAIQASCSLLTNAVNLSQESVERAKVELDKSLERMRQVIHEKTAPRSGSGPARKNAAEKPGVSASKAPSGQPGTAKSKAAGSRKRPSSPRTRPSPRGGKKA